MGVTGMATQQKPKKTETVPETWPGGFGIYSTSKEAMRTNIGTYVWIFLMAIAGSFVIQGLFGNNPHDGGYTLGQVLSFLFASYLGGAGILVVFKNLAHKEYNLDAALTDTWPFYLRLIGLAIVEYVLLALSILLFVVPFFFVLPRLVLAPYFLIDRNLGPIEAIKASWDETKGRSMDVWGITAVAILFALLMVTIIGIPFSIYFLVMYAAAPALLYKHITDRK